MLVSVIIPIYNSEEYLARCIQSILNQTYTNIEVILVNDGSTDESELICKFFCANDNRLKLISQKNSGVSEARNVALDIAKGDFISFVDSDDYVNKLYIETLLQLCMDYNCDVSQCSFYVTNKTSINTDQMKFKSKINLYDKKTLFTNRKIKITVWAKLYKSYLWEDIRFPVDKIYEDEHVVYKLLYASKGIVVSNLKLYFYYQSLNSITRSELNKIRTDFLESYSDRIDFFEREGDSFQVKLTKKELVLRAILTFTKARKVNIIISKQMLELIKKHCKEVFQLNSFYVEKFLIKLFIFAPNTTSFFLSKLIRLRRVLGG